MVQGMCWKGLPEKWPTKPTRTRSETNKMSEGDGQK